MLGERLADLRVRRQDDDAVAVLTEVEFLLRAHHALAHDAEDLALLDDERLLLAGLQRQREVRQNDRHLVARLMVRRAADDGALALAVGDAVDGELVRAGDLVLGEHLPDDDARKLAAELLHALDFEAEHGEALRELLGRPVEINVLLEPVKGDFHVERREG